MNYFIKSIMSEIEILKRKNCEQMKAKLLPNFQSLKDHSGGNLLHFFAKNTDVLEIEDKIKFLISHGLSNGLSDNYGKIPVEYLFSSIGVDVRKLKRYYYYEDQKTKIVEDSLAMFDFSWKNLHKIKVNLQVYKLLLPSEDIIKERDLSNKISILNGEINSLIEFKEGSYNSILEKELLVQGTSEELSPPVLKRKRM